MGTCSGMSLLFFKRCVRFGFRKEGLGPLSICSADRSRPSVRRRQGQGVRAAQAKTGPSYPCFQQISGPCRPFPTNSRHRAKSPSRMSCNRVCDDIGLTAGGASGGQKPGLCIGRGRKPGLCIGSGRQPGPLPPRREAHARLLSQKPSSRARLRLETPQGGFRTYTQSRILADS